MRRLRRKVLLRVDRDVVEVLGTRRGRPHRERWDVPSGAEPFGVLERAIGASRMLAPGRPCEIGVLLESERTRYRTVPAPDQGSGEYGRLEVILPDIVREVLDPIMARRRVHGTCWFAAGPAVRAIETVTERARRGNIGRGLIVDRSSVAVTVFLVDGPLVGWARGAAAADAPDVAATLLRRAAEVVDDDDLGLHWWSLTDVAAVADERRRRREASEFEARCHALVGHLPRVVAAP